jgi:L-cysteine/cystine lyase
MNRDYVEGDICTLAQLREDIALTRDYAYFRTGSHAPVPRSTLRFIADRLQEESGLALVAGSNHSTTFHQRAELARKTVADFLGVSPVEVAWTYNTTSATRMGVRNLNWKAGDRLAITDTEHGSTRDLVQALKELRGVKTTVIPSGDGPTFSPDYFLEQLDRLLMPDHRLLIMVHVSNIDGRRLPVMDAVRMAHHRGVKTLLDGAQSLGVFPINVGEIGSDYYSGSVHKWLLGPAGLGFLIVNREQIPQFNPDFMPVPLDRDTKSGKGGQLGASYFAEMGSPSFTLRMTAARCVEVFQRLGLPQIERYMRELSERLRDGLREVKGVRLAGPYPWELSSAITTIQLEDGSPERCQQLVERLREEYAIVVKFRPEICGIRISVAAFNSAEEVDRLLEALVCLVSAAQHR